MRKLVLITVVTLLPVSIGGGSFVAWLAIENGRGVVSSRELEIGMLVWCAAVIAWFLFMVTRWAKYWRSQGFRAKDSRSTPD
jgi:hypothetical protein